MISKAKKSVISVVFVLSGLLAGTQSGLADQSLPDFGRRAASAIEANLKSCGLLLINPHTPGLPYNTRWNARYAVVNRAGQALAYFVQDYGAGETMTWMNPNGGYRHSIRLGNWGIGFTTPLAGNVASASRFVTPMGIGYNFYCRSAGGMLPNWQMFEACVASDFVRVVSAQLCQYAN
ncbi:MAG: hypothetical protein RIQ81_2639 [Pseudomonadota bacterium]